MAFPLCFTLGKPKIDITLPWMSMLKNEQKSDMEVTRIPTSWKMDIMIDGTWILRQETQKGCHNGK